MDSHRIFETQDGTRSLFSERFGVSYHSKFGAWQETQHIFVDAGLRYASIDKQALHVLDIGFGTGLNAMAALQFADSRQLTLHYTAVEAFPVPEVTTEQLDYGTPLQWTQTQSSLFRELHTLPWSDTFTTVSGLSAKHQLRKVKQRFEELRYDSEFDVIFYDAFAPEAQPELWTPEIFAEMYAALRSGGVLVTYCAKGQVKRDMKSVGFTIERLAGPPGKREMTRASKE